MSETPGEMPMQSSRFLTLKEITELQKVGDDREKLMEALQNVRPANFKAVLEAARDAKAKGTDSEEWYNLQVNLHGLAKGIDYEHIWVSDFPGWKKEDFQALLEELGEA